MVVAVLRPIIVLSLAKAEQFIIINYPVAEAERYFSSLFLRNMDLNHHMMKHATD